MRGHDSRILSVCKQTGEVKKQSRQKSRTDGGEVESKGKHLKECLVDLWKIKSCVAPLHTSYAYLLQVVVFTDVVAELLDTYK